MEAGNALEKSPTSLTDRELCRGIHHITAIASDPKANLEFYAGFLGLRLVKKTVNFDDPNSYHLYYGDSAGSPGTIMTFFIWPGAPRGRVGWGQVSAASFSVPEASGEFWQARAEQRKLRSEPLERLDRTGLAVYDPDGMRIELIEAGEPLETRSDVPAEAAISGFYSATLLIQDKAPTAELLTSLMGFEPAGNDGRRYRYAASSAPGRYVDLVQEPGQWGRLGAGTVHHIAFRASDDDEQIQWSKRLTESGIQVTSVRDRTYFYSIYFSEPGGVLLEIATDPPGFALDEPLESLGQALKLPPWLEKSRREIEAALPSVD